MRKLETYDWWSQLLEKKDEFSLRELAEVFNVTPGAISAALKREGVTRTPAPPGPRAHRKRKEDEDLPPEPGEALARRRLVRPDKERALMNDDDSPLRPGSKDGLIQELVDLLGNVPDREVAEKAGVSVRTVASYRSRHEIAAYTGPRKRSGKRKRKSKIDPFANLLGTVPDRVVAEKADVSLNAVRNYRMKRGIAAAGSRGRLVSESTGAYAWKVTFYEGADSVDRVLVASNVVEAADLASGASTGIVVGITRVGEMLG